MSSDTFYEERFHRAGIAILGLRAIGQYLLPFAVLAVINASRGGFETADLLGETIPLVLFAGVLGAAAGAVEWATTRMSLSSDALTLRSGLLGKKETTVPLERVQALDELAGPLHRLFGLVRVDVQTAGGSAGGEISLAAVDRETLETLRRAVGLPERERGPARRLGPGPLLVAASTSGSLGVLLPVIAFVPQLFDELFLGGGEEDPGALLGLAPDTTAEWLTVAAGVLAVAWLLSALGVIVAFAGFEAERAGDRLLIRRGLLQRRVAAVPAARVQAVRVVEGLLRQPFGLASLRVEVAGYASEASAAQTLFPLLRRRDVPALLAALLPEMPGQLEPLSPAPRRALRRYVLPPALWAAAAAAAGWWLLDTPLLLLLVLPAALAGVLAHHAAGYRVEGGAVAIRSRKLARTTLVGPARLRQRHAVRQSLLQRRVRLADFEITLGAGGHARVRHLEAADAWAAFGAVSAS